ncbi:MAG TPA: 4-vinyl reductase [Anaerolineae bacterium]|nr:4-vinyl reductase [Anaerolineae bacterium]
MAEERRMPNVMLRNLLEAIAEVLGENGLKAVLNAAGLRQFIDNYPPNNVELGATFADYGAAEQAVEDVVGPKGAKMMLTRIGRATFRYALEEQPAVLGLAGVALKALPMNTRMKIVLASLAKAATKDVNQPTDIEEHDDHFLFVVSECPCRWRGKKDKPVCFVTVGVLHGALRWATGKNFKIKEVSCIAMGDDACRYRIDKEPLEE